MAGRLGPMSRQLQRTGCGVSGVNRNRILVRSKVDDTAEPEEEGPLKKMAKATGVSLGPISLSFGDDFEETSQGPSASSSSPEGGGLAGRTEKEATPQTDDDGLLKKAADAAGLSLGPISLTYGDDFSNNNGSSSASDEPTSSTEQSFPSISDLTTDEWREKYEKDGQVDLWVEEEFNSGSRIIGGRDVHKGGVYGTQTGEGPSRGDVAVHKVTIHNHYADQVVEVEVPEDRYILWEAEDHGLELPYACRMGCCTTCAVRVLEGEMYQPQALGVSEELKRRGYALMCVGYPRTDLKLETVQEDEVYDLQFGHVFNELALDKRAASIDRDDFALELADMDE